MHQHVDLLKDMLVFNKYIIYPSIVNLVALVCRHAVDKCDEFDPHVFFLDNFDDPIQY